MVGLADRASPLIALNGRHSSSRKGRKESDDRYAEKRRGIRLRKSNGVVSFVHRVTPGGGQSRHASRCYSACKAQIQKELVLNHKLKASALTLPEREKTTFSRLLYSRSTTPLPICCSRLQVCSDRARLVLFCTQSERQLFSLKYGA